MYYVHFQTMLRECTNDNSRKQVSNSLCFTVKSYVSDFVLPIHCAISKELTFGKPHLTLTFLYEIWALMLN